MERLKCKIYVNVFFIIHMKLMRDDIPSYKISWFFMQWYSEEEVDTKEESTQGQIASH